MLRVPYLAWLVDGGLGAARLEMRYSRASSFSILVITTSGHRPSPVYRLLAAVYRLYRLREIFSFYVRRESITLWTKMQPGNVKRET